MSGNSKHKSKMQLSTDLKLFFFRLLNLKFDPSTTDNNFNRIKTFLGFLPTVFFRFLSFF